MPIYWVWLDHSLYRLSLSFFNILKFSILLLIALVFSNYVLFFLFCFPSIVNFSFSYWAVFSAKAFFFFFWHQFFLTWSL